MKRIDYTIYNDDCLKVLPTLADNSIDCIITDPPYGISITRNAKLVGVACEKSRKATKDIWDDFIPTKKYFDEIFRVSKNQIIFGANYFWENFYASQCYLIRDKRGNLPDVPFCDTEFAWTSFIKKPSKRYVVINHGFIRDENELRHHPTQKPVILMQKIIKDFTKDGDLILDPFAGSFSTGVACAIEGRNFIGVEQDAKYCVLGEARIERAMGNPFDIPQMNIPDKPMPLFESI